MMKETSLLVVLTVVVALTFTVRTSIEDVATPEQRALGFSVLANKNIHVAETGSTLKTDRKAFGVWGYSTSEIVDTDAFLNQEVKYNGTTNVWEYSPLKYWDTCSPYEFYAYYPYRASGVTIDDNENITVTDFIVEPPVTDHVNLMLVDKATRLANAPVNQIIFNFNHLLSNINLPFKKDAGIAEIKVILKTVKIYGVGKKGTLVQLQVPEWAISDTDFVGANDSNLENLASDDIFDVATTVTFNDMLFIPQNTNSVKVDITYNLDESGAEWPFTRTLDLSYDVSDRTYNSAVWGQNQKITYNFIISANAIESGDLTVEDWATIIPDVEVPSTN